VERRVGDLEVSLSALQQWRRSTDVWMDEDRKEHKRMNDFMATSLATQEAIREEQSRRHRSNSTKLNVIAIMIGFGTLLIALASFMAVNFFHSHAEILDPAKIFHSRNVDPEYASRQKSADLPQSYVAR
jgi:hypothetical protein